MKNKSSKIGLGILLILLSSFTVGNVCFSSAECLGYSFVPLCLIIGGAYLIYKAIKSS